MNKARRAVLGEVDVTLEDEFQEIMAATKIITPQRAPRGPDKKVRKSRIEATDLSAEFSRAKQNLHLPQERNGKSINLCLG
jgi:hypothetical protein